MKRIAALTLVAAIAAAIPAFAHFFVVQPSTNMVVDRSANHITIDLRFAHPFAQGLMDAATPAQFGVLANGEKTDLLDTLKTVKRGEARTYRADYTVKRPGDSVFYVEPAPYWEPAEDKFIVHYTKTVVHAFGLEEGWDAMVGFPIEIQPLTRPYGLWTGNVFTGRVLLDGKPLPGAEIEVSYDNADPMIESPGDPYEIQIVTADENGVFTYAMPRAGWWGFAALADGPKPMEGKDGKPHSVEIGGLMWVNCQDMK